MSLLHGTEEVRALHASTCYGMERYRNGALDETESRSRQSSFNIRTWPDKSSVMQNCCNVSCSAQAAGNNRIAVQMAGFTGTMGLADVKSVDWMVFQTTVLDQAHSCPLYMAISGNGLKYSGPGCI